MKVSPQVWEDMLNNVEHPEHYNKGIECWDYIVSHNMDFLSGNIIKYVTRYKDKNGIEDLKKAKQYLDKLIEVEENKRMDEATLKKIKNVETLKLSIAKSVELRTKLTEDLHQVQVGLWLDVDELGMIVGQYEAHRYLTEVESKVWEKQ